MKRYREIEKTRVVRVLDKVFCDWCGNEIPDEEIKDGKEVVAWGQLCVEIRSTNINEPDEDLGWCVPDLCVLCWAQLKVKLEELGINVVAKSS